MNNLSNTFYWWCLSFLSHWLQSKKADQLCFIKYFILQIPNIRQSPSFWWIVSLIPIVVFTEITEHYSHQNSLWHETWKLGKNLKSNPSCKQNVPLLKVSYCTVDNAIVSRLICQYQVYHHLSYPPNLTGDGNFLIRSAAIWKFEQWLWLSVSDGS